MIKQMKLLVILNELKRGAHDDVYRALDASVNSQSLSDYRVFPFLEKLHMGHSAEETSQQILAEARDYEPQLILWAHTGKMPVSQQVIDALKALPGKPVMGYWDSDLYQAFFKPLPKHVVLLCKHCETIFLQGMGQMSDAMKRKGCNDIRFVPGVTDTDRFGPPPTKGRNLPYDVVMIGNNVVRKIPFLSMPGAHVRKRIVKLFSKKLGNRFAVFGNGWSGPSAQGTLPFAKQAEVYHQSRLALGNNNLQAQYSFSNRLPIALTSGIPILYQSGDGLPELFAQSPVVLFKNEHDAWEKTRKLLEKDQTTLDAIGLEGRAFALKYFPINKVMAYMIEVLKSKKTGKEVVNPWMHELVGTASKNN